MIEHILFPCDFSEQCSLAVPFVRAIANRCNAKLTLLTVIPEPSDETPAAAEAALEIEPKARLDAMLAEVFLGISAHSVLDSGDPATSIVEFAQENAVDLIMMPTPGYELFRSLLGGSVTEQVLHDAKCPVWTATYAEEQRPTNIPRTILCALDGTPSSLALLQWAAGFSHEMGATLKLIHAVPWISDAFVFRTEQALQKEANEYARAKIESLQRSAGIEAPLRVVAGPIAEVLPEAAEEEGADLILIGRGSLQEAFGRFRTHAYAIIRESSCPVLSV
jgi:nucleotide-binding universal stress UspA family protein